MRIYRYILNAVLIAGLLAGCSDSKPDSDNIAIALKGEFGNVIKVGEIERIDGVAYPGGAGVPESYKMEFKATLLAPGPVTLRLSNKKGEEARVKSIVAGHEPLSKGPHRWRTDETRPAIVIGAIQFVKAESGWRAGATTVFLTDYLMRAGSMPPPERFERIAEGIRDNEQQLIWTDRDNGSNVNWNAANQYCAALGVGWSLPSRDVLRSLSDPDRNNTNTQTWTYRGNVHELWIATPLIKLSSSNFWSSEHVDRSPILAWKMSFIKRGNQNSWRADQAVAGALCIKVLENIESTNPGQASADRFTAAGSTVSDEKAARNDRFTKTDWGVYDSTNNVTWADRDSGTNTNSQIAFCETLGAAWELPSVAELRSLYDESGTNEITLKVLSGGSTLDVPIKPATNLISLSASTFWSSEEGRWFSLQSPIFDTNEPPSEQPATLCVLRPAKILKLNTTFARSDRFRRVDSGACSNTICVNDSSLKLAWAQNDNRISMIWKDAQWACQSMGPRWELPTLKQLQSLYNAKAQGVDNGRSFIRELESGEQFSSYAVLTTTPFINLSQALFWSSEVKGPSETWGVDLSAGSQLAVAVGDKREAGALCVLPEGIPPAGQVDVNRFTKTDIGVLDAYLDRVWASKDSTTGEPELELADWPGAKRYCESLGSDWHLPSVADLQSLHDESGKHSTRLFLPMTCAAQIVTDRIIINSCHLWSDEPDEAEKAWIVNLANGGRFPQLSRWKDAAALCIRASP